MSFQPFVLPIILVWTVSIGIGLSAVIAGAFVYDVRAVKTLRGLNLHPHARAHRQRPFITVIISAHNAEQTIELCLNSIFKNNYRNVEVLVVDRASGDATKQVTNRFASDHPNYSIRLVARRTNDRKLAGIAQALNRHGKGELVTILGADELLERGALINIARQFTLSTNTDALVLNKRIAPNFKLSGLLLNYYLLLNDPAKKSMSVADLQLIDDASCFRAEIFQKLYTSHSRRQTAITPKVRYAHNAVVFSNASHPFISMVFEGFRVQTQFFSMIRRVRSTKISIPQLHSLLGNISGLISSLTSPLVAGYALYLALGLHEATWLWLGLSGISAFFLYAIWQDDCLQSAQKATYTFGVPICFSLILALTISRFYAGVKSLLPRRQQTALHRTL